ncbi:MAG: AI-2E family transporter [Anaerolineae bacterium]|nr:AI-2E family transporter [Anaerolineae bacterium]
MSYPRQSSPAWGKNTKRTIVLVGLVLLGLLAWKFQALVGELVVGAMIAYMLAPTIDLLSSRTFLSRVMAVLLIYLLLGIVVLGIVAMIGVAAYSQIDALLDQFPSLVSDVFDLFKQYVTSPETTITFGRIEITPYTFDWNKIEEQVLQMINPAISQGSQVITQVANGAVNVAGWLFITFIMSIYIAVEMPVHNKRLTDLLRNLGYGEDFERLSRGFNRIWNAYLRGQIILAIATALITSVALAILGVQNSLALGLLTGILQIVPYLGPVVAVALTALVALFQPGNHFGLMPFHYALLVTLVSIILQNVEAALLVPRVVGEVLNLSPLVVIISLLAGGALAGILGAVLAAPVVATLQLIGQYIWRKLLDQPPFPDPAVEPVPPPPLFTHIGGWLNRLRKKPQEPSSGPEQKEEA